MKRVLSASLGEVMLKGKNRKYFEDEQIKQIKKALEDCSLNHVYKEMGKIYMDLPEELFDRAIKRLRKVFGLIYISPCIKSTPELKSIQEAAAELVREYMDKTGYNTFKVETARADKAYPLKSPEISRRVGGYVLAMVDGLKVNVHKPDFTLYVDVKNPNSYIYIERFQGEGGMPAGVSGKGLLLLSGGIDSPVAGYLMAKRGMAISGLHFHSYPFTPERSVEKIKTLGNILSRYIGGFKIFSVNLLPIQQAIRENCKENYMTILSRRFMMRIGERLSEKNGYHAMITGESLGQVASQTAESMYCINNAVNMPILRPLIAMDKVDIVDISRDIETYETSILPYEDSCSVFLPKHPLTKPKLSSVLEQEMKLDVDSLIDTVISKMEIITIE
ncbi:MAG: tRNA 4-thiouridine(8) synthase ThiI [Tissierellia bacterium]|nr:tRNA 4-thiouridine(8) synthase ThiI [Tissierellia bacterium]